MRQKLFGSLAVCLLIVCAAQAQSEREIARAFAPEFTQGIGDKPRFDYFARFDFDGDWRGDNNWNNAATVPDSAFDAYIYYAVSETATHYFVHYAVYHPRDYKGSERGGMLLGDLLRQGAKAVGKRDPTGLLNEATLAHENDLEGCLVVAQKNGDDLSSAFIVYVETLSHNHFKRYAVNGGAAEVMVYQNHPRLYVEPKGHGIEALTVAKEEREKRTLLYLVGERAENPFDSRRETVAYDLLPMLTTLWTRAAKAPNATYGTSRNYGTLTLMTPRGAQKVKVGARGAAFLGKIGAPNAARPPWGWYDMDERSAPLGQWFFDPAQTIRRHFNLSETFSVAYTRHPLVK